MIRASPTYNNNQADLGNGFNFSLPLSLADYKWSKVQQFCMTPKFIPVNNVLLQSIINLYLCSHV